MTQPTSASPTLPTLNDFQALSQIATHPEYIKLIQQLEAIPAPQRLAQAKQLLTPQELTNRGIPIPPGFRITLRWFEDPGSAAPTFETTALAGNVIGQAGSAAVPSAMPVQAAWTVCGSVGFIACVSVGREL